MAMHEMNDPEMNRKMREMFGPAHVDQQLRSAMQMCWMLLPDDRRTVDELEKQFRRMIDRAIQDFRDDADAFGLKK